MHTTNPRLLASLFFLFFTRYLENVESIKTIKNGQFYLKPNPKLSLFYSY